MKALTCPHCGHNWRPRTLSEYQQAEQAKAIQKIYDAAEAHFGWAPADFSQRADKSRGKKNYTRALAWTARELRGLGLGLADIGQRLGGRHHTSIIHLLNKAEQFDYSDVDKWLEEYPQSA